MSMGSDGTFQSMFPFTNKPVYTITSIPMITLQIPPYNPGMITEPKYLHDAVNQTIWLNENRIIIPKMQSIIYSKEVLIFYVNRRIQRIQLRTYSNPLSFSQLPLTMSSFERLNSYPVNVQFDLTLGTTGEVYNLRSVVVVTETEIVQNGKSTNIITGCTGLLMRHRNLDAGLYDQEFNIYDPLGASLPMKHPNPDNDPQKNGYFTNKPISKIPAYPTISITETDNKSPPNFEELASKNGTIFIYAKSSGYNTAEVISI